MPNKKISQLSQISPVPTGGLMILANSGVSRSVTVKDVAEAVQGSSSNTFSGLNDTPTGISGDMFAVGSPDGTGIVFSKNLHLGTGHFLDKRYGGTISGTVTMATGEKIQFADNGNFINSAGESLAIYSSDFIKMRSTSGTSIYQVGGTEAKINFYTGYASENKVHVIQTSSGKYISSGQNHYLNSDTDISGKIFQSGKEILTGLYALKSATGILVGKNESGQFVGDHETGDFVTTADTGILVGKNESGQFVGTGVSGLFAEASKTGSFVVGSGVPANISAKWSSTGVLTSGITIDDGNDFYPNKTRSVSLGKSANRWKDIQTQRLVAEATGSSNAGDDSWITAKTRYTGDARAEFVAMNTVDGGQASLDVMRLGVSSTGVSSRNVGSGNYYLYGEGGSGKSFIIGKQHDLLFFANTGISHDDPESIAGGQNPPALKIHTSGLVTFSEAFTMPTGDGAASTFLQTDGAGTVSWGNASQTFTGLSDTPSNYTSVENHIVKVNAAGNAMEYFDSGVFVGENETGNLVDRDMTGHFADSFTGLSDVYTGADGLPQGNYGQPGEFIVVNRHSDGLIYSGATLGGGGGGTSGNWIGLDDTDPTSYTSQAGKIVRVNSTPNGLEFFDSGVFVGENQTGNFVDVDMTGNLVGIGMTGNLVDQDMTGILVFTGDTGNFVLRSQTGDFVDIYMTGNLVDIDMTGNLVDVDMTGNLVDIDMTGNLVDIDMTGILVGKNESGQFVGDHETGVFLTEQSLSGTYSTQFQIEVADNGGGTDKYYLSEITAGSHITTGRVLQPVINLNRGNTYKFKSTNSASNHGFYIATQAGGGPSVPHEYTSGVTNSKGAGEGQNIYFRVPQNAPEKLYYESNFATNMGSTITVWDDTGNFVLKSETGDFVDINMTGNLVGKEATGDFYSKRGGPISGDVSILGNSGLYVSGDLKVQSGISYNPSYDTGSADPMQTVINWASGNLLYTTPPSSINYNFINVTEGQTLTMYVHNRTYTDQSINFISGAPKNAVKWPADIDGNNNPPKVFPRTTNVYTFININTGIFASYLTGYDYIG